MLTTYFLHAARYCPLHDVPPTNNGYGRVEAAHRVPAPRWERVPPGLSRMGGDRECREVVSHSRVAALAQRISRAHRMNRVLELFVALMERSEGMG